jgi:hypothetical protein
MRRTSGPTPPLPVGQAVEMNATTGRSSQMANRPDENDAVHDLVTKPPGQTLNEQSPNSEYGSAGARGNPNMADLASPSSMYSRPPE